MSCRPNDDAGGRVRVRAECVHGELPRRHLGDVERGGCPAAITPVVIMKCTFCRDPTSNSDVRSTSAHPRMRCDLGPVDDGAEQAAAFVSRGARRHRSATGG